MAADAQFKEVGPPPVSAAAARQKFRTLLEKVDANNLQQTVSTISGLLIWYRDLFDEELIAAWQKDSRANLTLVMKPLADPRVASAVVEFSWRQRREATFRSENAAMFVELMSRYPASAKPFLDDLLGQSPMLSEAEGETVCRILIDMPDTDVWNDRARRILAQYRQPAARVLGQEARSGDQERAWRAQRWQRELGLDEGDTPRPRSADDARIPLSDQPSRPSRRLHVDGSHPALETDFPPPPPSAPVAPAPAPLLPYSGPRSGTLECSGAPIPQNGEYVFPNLPPGNLHLDYDAKTWDTRLLPGAGNTQRLVLVNKRPGTQKRCTVRWSLAP